jgi:hypothetical protein
MYVSRSNLAFSLDVSNENMKYHGFIVDFRRMNTLPPISLFRTRNILNTFYIHIIYEMLLLLFLFSLGFAYDQSISKHCVNIAQSSYVVSSVDQWNCITCDQSVKLEYVVEENGARALQGYDGYTNSIFVAFRGSSNLQNWLDNIQISKISPYNDKSINVEKGFYKAYNYVKHELISNLPILAEKYNTNRLLITGHSLGAAMATLMTYDIITLFSDYTVSYLINFGSPRVGNPAFVSSFNQHTNSITHYRITHYHDIVPHVPEEFLGYLHISNEIWYNEDNSQYKICNDLAGEEDKTCSNSCSPTHCTSTSDHLNYLNVTMGGSQNDKFTLNNHLGVNGHGIHNNLNLKETSTCVCTTTPCPVPGTNNLIQGGSADITYIYTQHSEHAVVTSAKGVIYPSSLGKGTSTTSCTQAYSRMLDDDGTPDCDAGHILAHHLGGLGNQPINIFPQSASMNRGVYAQFESNIYDCIVSGATNATLNWRFYYPDTTHTKPNSLKYEAIFEGGDCTNLSKSFDNTGN